MFLSFFIQSNQLFKTLIQSFYIALSQNTIRTRNKITAGVVIIRTVIIIRAGGRHPKIFGNFFSKKFHSAKNCAENEHSISLYIETNYSPCLYITKCYHLPLYMHPYLNTLTRLSAPYLLS